MIRKAFIAFLVLILVFVSTSVAWLRDANIADSKDSLGLGWLLGAYYLTGEKAIDSESTLGIYYLLPIAQPSANPVSLFQISYNRQVFGEINSGFAMSYNLGAYVLPFSDASWAVFPESWSEYRAKVWGLTILPDIGVGLSWKLFDPLVFRLHTILYLPSLLEFGYQYSENIEIGLGIGMPGQLLSFRYFM
ncbi:MAG: hypothetical protein ABH823_05935 [bacterium]